MEKNESDVGSKMIVVVFKVINHFLLVFVKCHDSIYNCMTSFQVSIQPRIKWYKD